MTAQGIVCRLVVALAGCFATLPRQTLSQSQVSNVFALNWPFKPPMPSCGKFWERARPACESS
jgi:hypothetical protein